MHLVCAVVVYVADSTSISPSNNCTAALLASRGLLHTSAAPVDSSSSSSSHTVTVVTSRYSLTESVGHCVERPMTVDSVRIVGNCIAPTSSSLSNHSSALRGLGPACASTAVSFSSAPLLKSAGSAIHRMENVPRLITSYSLTNTVVIKPGFHYPSSRAKLTARELGSGNRA